MKQYFYAVAFVTALAVAYAASQTTPQNNASQTPCTATPPAATSTPSASNNCAPTSRPTTAGSIAGSTQSSTSSSGTQTGVGTVNSAGANAAGAQGNVQSNTQGSAAAPSGSRGTTPVAPGSVSSGASSSGGGASGLPQSDIEGAASADAETVNLRTQVQGAIAKEPTLSNDHVLVNVTATTVELSGTVATGKEKQTAVRIAESYANNRKVVDHITVTGRGNAPVAPATPPPSSQSSSPQGASANPATPAAPQSNQSTQPGKKPVNQGDQSQTVPQR